MPKYDTIGLMSGTSCDGLDIALCRFEESDGRWSFDILQAKTIDYSDAWKSKLRRSMGLSGLELSKLDAAFGVFCGKAVATFLDNMTVRPLLVASHGHTVFHQPDIGLTKQIGAGNDIAVHSGIATVCDFRTVDVSLGGQGAPLVPFGDQLLFSDQGYCLNLGGIANLSAKLEDRIIALDICACNLALNALAQQDGQQYDHRGEMARHGNVDDELLRDLNSDPFFAAPAPKSLGKEWVDRWMTQIESHKTKPLADQLRTVVEHIAIQVTATIRQYPTSRSPEVLLTGGGTHNHFLVQCFREKAPDVIWKVPSPMLIEYKEALIFGFLGLMRWLGRTNTLASATGAIRDSSGGSIYLP